MKSSALTMLTAGFLVACSTAPDASEREASPDPNRGVTEAVGSGGQESIPSADANAEGCGDRVLRWGANIHDGFQNPIDAEDLAESKLEQLAATMEARHLRTARMDLWADDEEYLKKFMRVVQRLAQHHIGVEAILFNKYSKGQTMWRTCQNPKPMVTEDFLKEVEEDSYELIRPLIEATDGVVRDFELQNEVSLYENINPDDDPNKSYGGMPCARMQAANMRGMLRAITERRKAGAPLRVIVGATGRSFGFLRFMQEERVEFDVVGYHAYPAEGHEPLDSDRYFGAGGPLGQLVEFHRPIHINEFNCAEIYWGTGDLAEKASYENEAGQPVTELCLRSLVKHLKEIAKYRSPYEDAFVESVHFYEMWDEPYDYGDAEPTEKAPPENRFGLTYNIDSPKVHLYLASAFAGGALSDAEKLELTRKRQSDIDGGLLTGTEIGQWSGCGSGTP